MPEEKRLDFANDKERAQNQLILGLRLRSILNELQRGQKNPQQSFFARQVLSSETESPKLIRLSTRILEHHNLFQMRTRLDGLFPLDYDWPNHDYLDAFDIYYALGELQPARSWALKSVLANPLDPLPYICLAFCALETRDVEQSEFWLSLINILEPPDPHVRVAQGRLLRKLHRDLKAIEAFRVAFQLGLRTADFIVDFLTVLTGEGFYEEVVETAKNWATCSAGTCLDAVNILSGHAKLALMVDRRDFLKDAEERESSGSWLKAEAVFEKISEAIVGRVPFSLIRLGDGEARFLVWACRNLSPDLNDIEADSIGNFIWNNWFGTSIDSSTATRLPEIVDCLNGAIRNCDALGLSTSSRLRCDTSHYGYLAFQDRYVFRLLEEKRPPVLADALVHYKLQEIQPTFSDWLQDLDFLGVISPHHGLAEILQRVHHIRKVAEYVIPGEQRLPEYMRATQLHFPDVYDRLMSEIKVPRVGAVFLVAGGLLGKIYCNRVKMLGGIALDVGAIVDGWMGFNTRPGQLESFRALA